MSALNISLAPNKVTGLLSAILYAKTLWMCYIDAIPFFRATLTSNILFSAILFGGYYLLTFLMNI